MPARAALLPLSSLLLPPDLPVSQQAAVVIEHLKKHQVLIVSGETGSGKTTQLAKLCYLAGFGRERAIVHTQPRRIAAVSVAQRIAEETQSELGGAVGYVVRFSNKASHRTTIKVVTDGVLLAEIEQDPQLKRYDVVIIDEAHERSLNIDFLLGYLRRLLEVRKDLKVIITSATLNTEAFSSHFFNAPVLKIEGRTYPVSIQYQPLDTSLPEGEEQDPLDETEHLVNVIGDVLRQPHQPNARDVLVFLPGEREIRETETALRKDLQKSTLRGVDIIPLYARLTVADQAKVFQPGAHRRVILSTNVAETSLTVPRIGFVVDTGLARVKRYRYRSKVEQLLVEPISKAAAGQRAGRCGRIAPGVCVRVYDEINFEKRADQTDPEILRSSLASVILKMKSMHMGAIEDFPWVTPPSGKAIADAYTLLSDLNALDETGQLTAVGHLLVKLPLDPHLSRMLVAAKEKHCLKEMVVVVSFLSVDDVRLRPMNQESHADKAHERFSDDQSELFSILKLWQFLEEGQKKSPSKNQWYKQLHQSFISVKRVQEWSDVYSEISKLLEEQGWKLEAKPLERAVLYPALHRSLLTGLSNSVGQRGAAEVVYSGPRGVKFQIWPGSYLFKKKSPWVLAAELVETSKLYARWVASIEPKWIEEELPHLIKTQLNEPHWEKKQGAVVAHQSGFLHGLLLYQGRRVNYDRFDPVLSRQLFIQQALVARDYDCPLPFWKHNEQLFKEIERLEHQTRRQGVWVDEAVIEQFYDRQIPADVSNTRTFEHWWKQASQKEPKLLFLSKEMLLHKEDAQTVSSKFPKQLPVGSDSFKLDYHFEPGSSQDGVTVQVPLTKMNQVPHTRCEWLVPGLLAEKVEALLRSLPQRYRRHLLPLSEYVADFCERHQTLSSQQTPLIKALVQDIRTKKQIQLTDGDFKIETLPPHLWMNFSITDEHGQVLDKGRNFLQLKNQLADKARSVMQQGLSTQQQTNPVPKTIWKHWGFGPWQDMMEIQHGQDTLLGYAALRDVGSIGDTGEGVELTVFESEDEAKRVHDLGLLRLIQLNSKDQLKQLEKTIPAHALAVIWAGLENTLGLSSKNGNDFSQSLLHTAVRAAYLGNETHRPQNENEFNQMLQQGRGRIGLILLEQVKLMEQILNLAQQVNKKMNGIKPLVQGTFYEDMKRQLQGLFEPIFMEAGFQSGQLSHYPRYLKGMMLRVERAQNNQVRDIASQKEIQRLFQTWIKLKQQQKGIGVEQDKALDELRWMIEEFRVSLFAQELKTPMPISAKRIDKWIEQWKSR